MAANSGGPAFPVLKKYSQPNDATGQYDDVYAPHGGMTLRDYFAIHGDQPGQLEIATAAGVETADTCALEWDDPKRKDMPRWAVWFNGLPQDERMRLYAKVRYQVADAMLAERSK